MQAKTTRPSEETLAEIRKRDKVCVYCGKDFDKTHHTETRVDWDELEHLNHKPDWDSVGCYMREGKPVSEIVAICCKSCNSSRGSKSLLKWFKKGYCAEGKNSMVKIINEETVANVVKKYIDKYEKTS